MEYDCPGAYSIPKDPASQWPERWQGWGDFLGLMYTMEEAKAVMANLGIRTEEGYREAQSKIDPRLPYMPDKYYSDWKGWGDFLAPTA